MEIFKKQTEFELLDYTFKDKPYWMESKSKYNLANILSWVGNGLNIMFALPFMFLFLSNHFPSGWGGLFVVLSFLISTGLLVSVEMYRRFTVKEYTISYLKGKKLLWNAIAINVLLTCLNGFLAYKGSAQFVEMSDTTIAVAKNEVASNMQRTDSIQNAKIEKTEADFIKYKSDWDRANKEISRISSRDTFKISTKMQEIKSLESVMSDKQTELKELKAERVNTLKDIKQSGSTLVDSKTDEVSQAAKMMLGFALLNELMFIITSIYVWYYKFIKWKELIMVGEIEKEKTEIELLREENLKLKTREYHRI